jgi:hypothetical protein
LAKTAVTTATDSLPSLYTGDAVGISELEYPKVYVQADLSQLVKARITEPGDVILALGADDVSPDWLIGGPDKRDAFDAFILGRRRFVARQEQGGDIEWLPDDYQRTADDRDVWVGYRYLLAIPEVNEVLPASIMLWKTSGQGVYKKINTYIQMAQMQGVTDPVCVRFTVTQQVGRKSGKPYWALVPAYVKDPAPGQLAIAKQMLVLAGDFERGQSAEPAGDTPTY